MTHSDLGNSHYRYWSQFLQASEGWSPEVMRWYQLNRLQEMVLHAYIHAPGYRKLYDRVGIHPADIRTLSDLTRLPFITKSMMQEGDFHVENVVDRWFYSTGGSTGSTLWLYRDPAHWAYEQASKAHLRRRVGWDESHKIFLIKGYKPIESPDHIEELPQFNEVRCSSFHLSADDLERYRQRAWAYEPDWLLCYPSTGYIMARFLQDTGRTFLPIRGVLCCSEMLYEEQKRLMAEVFDARVFSHYGQTEGVAMASFCEHEDTYHVLPQYGLAELVDSDGDAITVPDQVGEIVGTSFTMRATPFVRYRTGDYAVYQGESCVSCRRQVQIWSRIEGKSQDYLVTRDGHLICATGLNIHGEVGRYVRQFQFVQTVPGYVTFKYVPREGFVLAEQARMRARIRAKLDGRLELEMEAVADIPRTLRGKHMFVRQEVDIEVAF